MCQVYTALLAMIDGMENPRTAENLARHIDETLMIYDIWSSPQYSGQNLRQPGDARSAVRNEDTEYLRMEECQALQTYRLLRLMAQQEHHWGDTRFSVS